MLNEKPTGFVERRCFVDGNLCEGQGMLKDCAICHSRENKMNSKNGTPCQDSQTWASVAEMVNRRVLDNGTLTLAKAGDKAVVAFIGEPFAYEAIWNESNGWVPFNEKNPLHKDIVPGLCIRINVVVVNAQNIAVNNRVAYWETGPHTFKNLVRMRDKYGLDKWLYEIEKLDGDDAEPHYTILPDREIDDEMKFRIAALPRIALAASVGLPDGEG